MTEQPQEQKKSMNIDDVPTCEEHWKKGEICTPNCIGCSHPHLISPHTQDTTEPDSLGKYAIEPWERDAIIKQIRKDAMEKVPDDLYRNVLVRLDKCNKHHSEYTKILDEEVGALKKDGKQPQIIEHLKPFSNTVKK